MFCTQELDHKIITKFNGLENNSNTTEFNFRPADFIPKVYSLEFDTQLEPNLRDSSIYTDIRATVKDFFNCGYFLDDIEIEIKTNVIDQSGGHTHDMGENNIGTGNFIPNTAPFIYPNVTIHETGTRFESPITGPDPNVADTTAAHTRVTGLTGLVGETGSQAQFQTRYVPGEYGIEEDIIVTVKRDTAPLPQTHIDETLTIAVPGLIEITNADAEVTFADGGTCPHPGGGSSTAHFLTPATHSSVATVADQWFINRGVRLSLNDASLENGGTIDNVGGGGRLTRCHGSHRTGRDIDINKNASGGLALDGTDTFILNGRVVRSLAHLTSLFNDVHMVQVTEQNSLHYRR